MKDEGVRFQLEQAVCRFGNHRSAKRQAGQVEAGMLWAESGAVLYMWTHELATAGGKSQEAAELVGKMECPPG